MLDVIGPEASATSREDWHEMWCNSDEITKIQEIHAKRCSQPADRGRNYVTLGVCYILVLPSSTARQA